MSPRLAIVGGGIAGLAALAEAHARGVPAVLYEPRTLGGVAVTRQVQPGWTHETGPTSFTARSAALVQLIDRLGLRDELEQLGRAARQRFLRRNGQLRANLSALSWRERWGLVTGMFQAPADAAEVSVRDWAAARFGDVFADEVVGAMVTGIWAADGRELEMASAFPAVFAAARGAPMWRAFGRMPKERPLPGGTWSLRGGLGRIGETAAARWGNTVRRAEVAGISAGRDGWTIHADDGEVSVARVVLATPAGAAAPLLGDVAPAAALELGQVRSSPIVAAHWLATECHFPTGFGYLAGPQEGAAVLGSLFTGDLFPDRSPRGLRAGVTLLGGTREPDAVRLADDAIRGRLEREHELLTGRPLRLEALDVVRHPRAVPLPTPGHAARRLRVHAALPPGLALAGAWDGDGSMEAAAASGRAAAERMCA